MAKARELVIFKGSMIRSNGDRTMVCLTDIWKAVGSPDNKQPAQWRRSVEAKEIIGYIDKNHPVVGKKHNGCYVADRQHGSWGSPHVALAYTKTLNTALFYEILDVYLQVRMATTSHEIGPSIEDTAKVVCRELSTSEPFERLVLGILKGNMYDKDAGDPYARN